MSDRRRYMGKAGAMAIPRGTIVEFVKNLGRGRCIINWQGKEYLTLTRLCWRLK